MTLYITPTALEDMQQAREYSNERSANFGHRFVAKVKEIFIVLTKTPTGFVVRYNNVRVAKVKSFPFLVFYLVDTQKVSATILRVFNSYWEQYR